jgi:hypothetical protein
MVMASSSSSAEAAAGTSEPKNLVNHGVHSFTVHNLQGGAVRMHCMCTCSNLSKVGGMKSLALSLFQQIRDYAKTYCAQLDLAQCVLPALAVLLYHQVWKKIEGYKI